MGILDIFKKKPNIKVGDSIYFGKYYFENEKDIQPIEWMVLDCNGSELLLLSKYCLDVARYCDPWSSVGGMECSIWEKSYLRNWLNAVFYNQVFSEKEKQRIVETQIVTDPSLNTTLHKNKVFILSKEQVLEHLPHPDARMGFPTPYALQKGANTGYSKEMPTWWWTLPYVEIIVQRQPARIDFPSLVCQDGQVNYHSRLVVHSSNYCVRPAIKIKK